MLPPNQAISRRQLFVGAAGLAGAAGAGLALAACGDSTTSFTVVQRYPSTAIATGDVRLPISLADRTGTLTTTGPGTITGRVNVEGGAQVDTFRAIRRGAGLDVPYWSIEATIAKPGLYEFVINGFTGEATPFQVFDPATIKVASAGTALQPFDTPTMAEPRGVDPVCTRLAGPCPFHAVSLTDALKSGKPVVYLVGTPAHCQTATCGPSLDVLIDVAKNYTDRAVFVHAEVYADQAGTKRAPAFEAAGIDYEPVLWITNASGIVQRRVDVVWDHDELTALMQAALA